MSTRARYHCCSLKRRNEVDAHPTLNGLEALEVIDRDLPPNDPLRQRTLLLYFLKPVTTAGFTRDHIRITGGERIRNPSVEWAQAATPMPPQLATEPATRNVILALAERENILVVRVAQAGDYSRYTLRLASTLGNDAPPPGFDPRMVEVEFSFKAECPSDLDCLDAHACPAPAHEVPDIDYLARDFPTFRRLLLDRMAQQVPGWTERNPADAGMAMVELLAYVGDQLSYRQDAIATEAYLGTARRRVSVRRHARLVDYDMHDGCNARTFVHLRLFAGSSDILFPARGTRFLTRCERVPRAITTGSVEEREAREQHPIVFEPVVEDWYDPGSNRLTKLKAAYNALSFYTWSDEQCCLPRGATRATLLGAFPDLMKDCEWLLFEETKGPRTGHSQDADVTHRQVVRLKSVAVSRDLVPAVPVDVTEIEWEAEDALTFPLCISSVGDGNVPHTDVSVARGNLVLADHGETRDAEPLGAVPPPRVIRLANDSAPCKTPPVRELPVRYRPMLASGPLTQAAAVTRTSARTALKSRVSGTRPHLKIAGTLNGNVDDWPVQRNLLDSAANQPHVMIEVESDGIATLRFGDGVYGRAPVAGTRFEAVYRVGNGTPGNIGAGALAHVVGLDVTAIEEVRNPIPADSGTDPEPIENVRRRAPEAFRSQKRAVTPADYIALAQKQDGVDRAACRPRWTGSWHTMFVTVDRTGGAPLDASLRAALTRHIDGYRMAGHDIAFEEPVRVSLELALHVCVKPEYFRSDVKRALLDLFSSGTRRDGSPGLFHPDRFSFGDTVYLSPLVAAAHEVPGVASVSATKFGRQGEDDPRPLEDGRLALGDRQIARLDNDPNFPEHGTLSLVLHGGK